jgi:hypothetical protein
MDLEEYLDVFFHYQLLKIAVSMASWAPAWQKTSSVRTAWSFKPKNNSKSLLGPSICKLQQWFRPWGRRQQRLSSL